MKKTFTSFTPFVATNVILRQLHLYNTLKQAVSYANKLNHSFHDGVVNVNPFSSNTLQLVCQGYIIFDHR